MADNTTERKTWPSSLQNGDKLYAIVDAETNSVKYLIYSSMQKKASFARDRMTWQQVDESFFEKLENYPQYYVEDVLIDAIAKYDEIDKRREIPSLLDLESSWSNEEPVTAAGDQSTECPPATLDIALNLKNRRKAIRVANYGPLDPSQENASYWKERAKTWSVTPEEAKSSLCGNCAMFSITTKMLNCIADGIAAGGSGKQDAWDPIDAGQLGYCEAFDFKCASSRTCDAWVTGGPITDESLAKKEA